MPNIIAGLVLTGIGAVFAYRAIYRIQSEAGTRWAMAVQIAIFTTNAGVALFIWTLAATLLWPPFGVWLFGLWP